MSGQGFEAIDKVLEFTAPLIAMRTSLVEGGFSERTAEVIVLYCLAREDDPSR